MRISEHFNLEDFLRSETAAARNIPNVPSQSEIDNLRFVAQNLDGLVRFLGPTVKMHINSGFRSERVNKLVGGSKYSQHRLGEAADLLFYGCDALKVFDAIRTNPNIKFDQMIFERKGNSVWVHLSFTRRRTPRRSVLVAHFVGGKARYGKPKWKPVPFVPPNALPASSPVSHVVDASKQPLSDTQQSVRQIAATTAAPELPPVDVLDTHPPDELVTPLSKAEAKLANGSPELLAYAREKGMLLLRTWTGTLTALGAATVAYLEKIWGYMQTPQFLAVLAILAVFAAIGWLWYHTHEVHKKCHCPGDITPVSGEQ